MRQATNGTSFKLIGCVLLPFAAGYFLSYVLRTINALIAGDLSHELAIGPTELGLLTSTYFLATASVQLPLGTQIDRYGPRRVQSACLLIAAVGAVIFATADNLAALMVGRILIGVGVATALMAGLKAIMLWFPKERIASANGLLVMIGALGALAATAPAEALVAALGWRGLFAFLAALFVAVAVLIMVIVPEKPPAARGSVPTRPVPLRAIYADPRFQRVAPLSALCVGTAWSLQGLWAAPWLMHVEGLPRADVVRTLLAMGLALAAGALALGWLTDRTKAMGISREALLGGVAGVFIAAQVAVILRLPIPGVLLWSFIATVGALTVVSYAIVPSYFPGAMSGRANAALNFLHMSAAFAMQSATGAIVDLWPPVAGHPPVQAYQVAFGLGTGLQALALLWFMASAVRMRAVVYAVRHPLSRVLEPDLRRPLPSTYERSIMMWVSRNRTARAEAVYWKRTAIASGLLMVAVASAVTMRAESQSIPYVVAAFGAQSCPSAGPSSCSNREVAKADAK